MASILPYNRNGKPTRYRAHIRLAGKPPKSKVFDKRQDAIRWARQQEALADAPPTDGLRLTLARVIDEYLKLRAFSRTKKSVMNTVKKSIGSHRLDELTPSVFVEHAKRRANAGVGPATVSIDLTFTRSALRHAGVAMDVDTSAALAALEMARGSLSRMRIAGASHQRSRRPTEDELKLLRERFLTSVPHMWDITLFAICTCMRLGEITRVTFDAVDRDKRLLLIKDRKHPTKKVGNDQWVPLLVGPVTFQGNTVDPLQIIDARPKLAANARIFPHATGTISHAFHTATIALGIDDLHFHDLRHEGVSRLFEHGYAIEQVAMVSGHRSWKNLQRYTNLKPESLHKFKT